MSESITKIQLGRSGYFKSNGDISLEVQRFAGNRPSVRLIVGVGTGRSLRTEYVQPYSQERTSGKNGHDEFRGVSDGLYHIQDILDSGSRRYEAYVLLENEELTVRFKKDELDELFEKMFPLDMAQVKEAERLHQERMAIAQKILAEIAEERKEMSESVTDGELIAYPEFRSAPTAEEVIRKIASESFDRDQFVMELAVPVRFVINEPVFSKASTSADAFAQARAVIEARTVQLAEAKEKAEVSGWPELKGTPKQIKWAETIRAKVASKDPHTKALKTASTAKYWIENYRNA